MTQQQLAHLFTPVPISSTPVPNRILRTSHAKMFEGFVAELAQSRRLMAQAFQSADAREARAAFAQKRKPQFSGR